MTRACVSWTLAFSMAFAPLAHAETPSGVAQAENAPPEAAPSTPVTNASAAAGVAPSETTSVEFATGQEGISIHLRTGEGPVTSRRGELPHTRRVGTFARVCVAPCSASLALGVQPLAVALGDRTPLLVRGGVEIQRGSNFRVSYQSRRHIRIAGGVILGVFGFVGILLTVAGIAAPKCADGFCANPALYGPGIALAGAGIVAGPIMLTRRDVARITPLAIRF